MKLPASPPPDLPVDHAQANVSHILAPTCQEVCQKHAHLVHAYSSNLKLQVGTMYVPGANLQLAVEIVSVMVMLLAKLAI